MPNPTNQLTAITGDINVGQDISITFTTDDGRTTAADSLGLVMEFSAKSENIKLKVTPISHRGKPRRRTIPSGWNGSVKWTRVNGNVTKLIAGLTNDFYETGALRLFSLSATITNRDGSQDRYLFTNCSLSDGDFGSFEANKEVSQELSFEAEAMQIVTS